MFIHNSWQLAVRLILAQLVGGIIGFNRQKGGRSAGMRTFMLVNMGAALFVMIPLQAEGDSTFASTNALSRTLQGVTTGVGLLGAGFILQPSSSTRGTPKVRGLTTAASVWVATALGAATGCGLWQVSLLGAFLTLFTLSSVKRVHRKVKFHTVRNKRSLKIASIKNSPEQSKDYDGD
ncbi:MAG: MgtC/SapB family protein [Pseudanabaena sp.]